MSIVEDNELRSRSSLELQFVNLILHAAVGNLCVNETHFSSWPSSKNITICIPCISTNIALLPAAVVHELYSEFLSLWSRLNLILIGLAILEYIIRSLLSNLSLSTIVEDDVSRSLCSLKAIGIDTVVGYEFSSWPWATYFRTIGVSINLLPVLAGLEVNTELLGLLILIGLAILELEIFGLDCALTFFNTIVEDDILRSDSCLNLYLVETIGTLLQLSTWPSAKFLGLLSFCIFAEGVSPYFSPVTCVAE